jgi:hypothetical protein
MSFSHRDLRAHRAVDRLIVAVTAGGAAILALAVVVPTPWLGVLAVVALAVVGAASMEVGNAIIQGYEDDLRITATLETDRLGRVGVEVRSSVSHGPPGPSPRRRSPHVRRRPSRPEDRDDGSHRGWGDAVA